MVKSPLFIVKQARKTMPYHILTKNSVISHIVTIPAIREFLGEIDADLLQADEIGDGNLNLVFIVSDRTTQKKLIVKQAVPYLRCAGEDYPLAKERMHYEIRALHQFSQLAAAHTPEIYSSDEDMCLVAMQFLGTHIIMRKGLIAGVYYPHFANHISSFLAESLFKTSSLFLDSTEKFALVAKFNQNQLRKLTENFVFTFPFMPHKTNRVHSNLQQQAEALWADASFKKNVLQLKNIFMNKTEALLHGDLHTGSIMLNAEETFVIDPEFAFVGPFGFDIGALLANLILSWLSHFERSRDTQYQEWILTTIRDFLLQFEQKFLLLWKTHPTSDLIEKDFLSAHALESYQRDFMQTMLQEAVGFAGCKMARRQLGLAGVEDITGIPDEEAACRVKTLALQIAREFVVNHQRYNHVDDIIATLRQFAPIAVAE
jgi:5-methylthioribose kinase